MKNFCITIIGLLCCFTPTRAQEGSIDLDMCQQKARENYPQIKQYGLIEASAKFELSNLSKAYLPQITLNGQASYQSDVTSLPISLPGIQVPTLDKDQYKLALDVSQSIWDGGRTQARRKLSEAEREVDKQTLEVELYAIRDRINQLYFGLLALEARQSLNRSWKEALRNTLQQVKALQANGAATQSDADLVQVEWLKLEQQETELSATRTAYLQVLSAMTALPLDEKTVFRKPQEKTIDPQTSILRPELGLFAQQEQARQIQQQIVSAQNRPQLALFAQGGYGKPGLNMLSNGFDWFGIAGLRISWNFGRLYSLKNDKRLIETGIKRIGIQRETFEFNTRLQLRQAYNEVIKSQQIMLQDGEIVRLRQNVRTASESKYRNGVYTTNDLVKDLEAEMQARQTRQLHEIQYLMAIYQYGHLSGN